MFSFWRKPVFPDFVRAYTEAPRPEPARHWREVGYSVLDIETSGLNHKRDALLAIGLVEIEEGRIHLNRHWYTLVRPPEGLEVDASSIRIHGITRAELEDAPLADVVLPELLARLAGRVMVVHVAQVDVSFLNQAMRTRWGAKLVGPIIDTARIAMSLHETAKILGSVQPDMPMPAIQLRALATRFGLPSYGEHNALNDALTTAQLFLAQATRLEGMGRPTLRGLMKAGGV
ncbi:DNA polymerase III, epsilon subunit [Oscillochloris trichoides DG-6]|uniref:DNA polymerase III, epsilon subunit n=1 Tax=Oscillochloris trichoides DG-6 TaxID=765420 RepID=E1IAM5_9CHLR|nr:DNA polymerase III, epsilon subunit [Oscillochloris trichoides DG-6]